LEDVVIEVFYDTTTSEIRAGVELGDWAMPATTPEGAARAVWDVSLEEFSARFSAFSRPAWDGAAVVEGASEAEILAEAKAKKEAELILAADAEEKAVWTAEIEFKYVLVKRAMGQAISAPQQQKAQAVLDIFAKLEQKIPQVAEAKTVAEVEAVNWTA
jgi:hypothetical protein